MGHLQKSWGTGGHLIGFRLVLGNFKKRRVEAALAWCCQQAGSRSATGTGYSGDSYLRSGRMDMRPSLGRSGSHLS